MGYPPENPQDSGISLTHSPRPATLPRRFKDQAVSRKETSAPRALAASTACGLGLAAVNQRLPVFHGTRPGWIEVIAGVMFSGKSEELVRRVRRPGSAGRPSRAASALLVAPQ